MSEEQNQQSEPQESASTVNKNDEVMVVSRVTLNYVLIGITFLMVGILIGMFGLGNNTGAVNVTINEDDLREALVSVLQDTELNIAANGGGGGDASAERFALVDDDPYIGNEDAPIVIVEFSDFFCSFCKRHFDQTFVPILENYGQHIRYVYRDFAQLTPESQPAAAAAQCAHEQGAFWEFHGEFFDNQQSLGREFYISTAENFELDVDAYTACLDEARYVGEVEIDTLDGQLEGVRGTPGFFVNGQFISGAQPYQLFERVIQRELRQAGISLEADEAPAEDDSDA